VPRGKRRQDLHEAGAIIDLVDFYTNWSEEKVREVIEEALGGIVDTPTPPPPIEFSRKIPARMESPPLQG
jgi:hypothetical protein